MNSQPAIHNVSAAPIGKGKRRVDPATTELTLDVAALIADLQGEDLVVLDMSGPLVIADYFVVATVRNSRQAQAIARELDLLLKHEHGIQRRNRGTLQGEEPNWVLLDYDDIVVHLFLAEARAYYGLEALWADVPRVGFAPGSRAVRRHQPKVRVEDDGIQLLTDS